MKSLFSLLILVLAFQANAQLPTEPFGVPADDKWDLRAFPNPTSDVLFVKSSKEIKAIEFYDIEGKQIQLTEMPNNSFSLANVPAGWLFMLVQSQDGFYQRKSVYKN